VRGCGKLSVSMSTASDDNYNDDQSRGSAREPVESGTGWRVVETIGG
jgi:hypothetical protein